MGILALVLFGLIAGAIAQLLMPGDDPGGGGLAGFAVTAGIGILGAFIGGVLASLLGFGGITGFNLGSVILAVAGAILLLVVWRAISGGGRRPHAV